MLCCDLCFISSLLMYRTVWALMQTQGQAPQQSSIPSQHSSHNGDDTTHAAGHDAAPGAMPPTDSVSRGSMMRDVEAGIAAGRRVLGGVRTTRHMLGYPPPMRSADGSTVRVLRWSRGRWGAVHAVEVSTVPITLRCGEWPTGTITLAPTSQLAATGSHCDAALLCSATVGQQAANEGRTENLLPHRQYMHVRPCDRSHVAGDDDIVVTAYPGGVRGTGQPTKVGAAALLAQQKGQRPRGNDQPTVAHHRQTIVVATARLATLDGGRSVRRVLPGFEGATQEQREAARQNPAWALAQVIAHCTDAKITDSFRAW